MKPEMVALSYSHRLEMAIQIHSFKILINHLIQINHHNTPELHELPCYNNDNSNQPTIHKTTVNNLVNNQVNNLVSNQILDNNNVQQRALARFSLFGQVLATARCCNNYDNCLGRADGDSCGSRFAGLQCKSITSASQALLAEGLSGSSLPPDQPQLAHLLVCACPDFQCTEAGACPDSFRFHLHEFLGDYWGFMLFTGIVVAIAFVVHFSTSWDQILPICAYIVMFALIVRLIINKEEMDPSETRVLNHYYHYSQR